ncbi:MAG: DMT family transporter [Thermoanaerobaculia bacterium]|jgi:drug/metabolite transporter (DMT)-like permease|nr:DMT family transporter [Thermoanaerobaculia bacterium]
MPEISTAVLLALVASFAWSLFDLERRFLSMRIEAMALVAGVTLGAVPPLAIWAWFSGPQQAQAAYWLPATGSVLLNLWANFAYFRSLQLSPLSQTLPMLSFTPAFAAVLSAIFLGERLGLRPVCGLFLVVGGALLLTLRSGSGLRGFFVGLLEDRGCRLMVGVAFLWSAALLLDKQALALATPHLHALYLNGGVAAGALIALAAQRDLGKLGALRGSGWLLLLAIATGAVAIASQLVALGSVGVGFLETVKRGVGGVLAVIWGRALLAEPVTLAKVVAVGLMSLGVGLVVL